MKREDVSVEFEELIEFKTHDDFSIFYSSTNNIWFIEDFSEDGRITILEDIRNNIFMKDEFKYGNFPISKSQLDEYKEIVSKNPREK